MARLFLLLLTIAALILHEGEAIKCWSCNSNGFGGRGCADPFGGSTDISDDLNMFSIECDKTTTLLNLIPGATDFIRIEQVINDSGLMIFCYKLTGLTLGAPFVLRGCAAGMPNITETSCMYAEPQNQTGGVILTCDACSADFCNGAADVVSAEPEKQTRGHNLTCDDCSGDFYNGAADVVSAEPEKQTRGHLTCDDCSDLCSGAAGARLAAMLFVVTLLLLSVKTTSV